MRLLPPHSYAHLSVPHACVPLNHSDSTPLQPHVTLVSLLPSLTVLRSAGGEQRRDFHMFAAGTDLPGSQRCNVA